MSLYLSNISLFSDHLTNLPDRKLLISTINAHSFNKAQDDPLFAEALRKSDVILPDGVSIVLANYLLKGTRIRKIAGADLFDYELSRLNSMGGTCFFLGSSESTLGLIYKRMTYEFPNIKVHSYSPPFSDEFASGETDKMISIVNSCNPDTLFIGMTAPKQEKWAYTNFNKINSMHICSIGAVFDFYAGTISRAPEFLINSGLEWFFRLLMEPRRMWKRYLIGNFRFIYLIFKEKIRRINLKKN